MRNLARSLVFAVLFAFLLGTSGFAGEPSAQCSAELRTATGGCATKKEIGHAASAFARGQKLQDAHRASDAFDAFAEAARLLPHNLEYASAREIARQQLVYQHLEHGNQLLLDRQPVEALAEFRAALELDPSNAFAQQRLMDALGEQAPRLSRGLKLAAASTEIELKPQPGVRSLHYRGDTRGLISQLCSSFGITATLDDSVVARPVRFDADGLDFDAAMRLAAMMGKVFWTPLSESQVLVAADTPENRRQFDRMSSRTFYLSSGMTPQEINDLVGALRGLFDIRSISLSPSRGLVTVRAPKPLLDAATSFVESLSEGRPQVLLDVKVFQISHTALRNLGVQLPLQYQLIHIPSLASLIASTPDLQTLINQLIASGGINQANSEAIAALLAQVQASQLNPLLTTPFATFGGGNTLFAVTIPPATLNVTFNSSNFKNLEHMTLRATDGSQATFFVGTRFPVLNSTFSPIFNTPAIARVIANQSFLAPFPSFTYENLGMNMKATPEVHGTSDVTLLVELELRQLSGQAFNGIPVIGNREYKGWITIKDGETALVVGDLDQSLQLDRSGLVGAGSVPALRRAVTNSNRQESQSELLVVITPHIVAAAEHAAGRAEIWLPPSSRSAGPP